MQISSFETVGTVKPYKKRQSLYELITTVDYEAQVNELRALEDKPSRTAKKQLLPAYTASGIFNEPRSIKTLLKHSGFICIDIDDDKNTDITNFKQLKVELSKILNVAFCAHSVGGKGFFVLIPVADGNNHERYFDALQAAFMQLGIIIDPNCRDVSRLRIVSFDDNYYMANEAVVFEAMLPEKAKVFSTVPANIKNEKFHDLLTEILSQKKDITAEYGDWFAIGCALANTYGERGREYFHIISQYYPAYNLKEANKQFNACLKGTGKGNGYKMESLYRIARKYL